MKKTFKKSIILLALAVIVAGVFVGYTFSKYTNTVTGNGEVEIAKWSFKVNESTEQFETIKLADTYDKTTLIDGKIAPGTSGSFDLIIDATESEVGVEYTVDFENEINKPTNLKFKYNDKTFDSIEGYEEYFTEIINADDDNKVRTLTVEWEWQYESGAEDEIASNDEIDTKDGLSALDYTFDVVVKGVQVIPSK